METEFSADPDGCAGATGALVATIAGLVTGFFADVTVVLTERGAGDSEVFCSLHPAQTLNVHVSQDAVRR